MFNDIYCVDLAKQGIRFAVKMGLSTEILLDYYDPKTRKIEQQRCLLCEMNDEIRALVLELNEIQRGGAK